MPTCVQGAVVQNTDGTIKAGTGALIGMFAAPLIFVLIARIYRLVMAPLRRQGAKAGKTD